MDQAPPKPPHCENGSTRPARTTGPLARTTGPLAPIWPVRTALEPPSEPALNDLAGIVERRTMMRFGPERRSHFVGVVTNRARIAGEAGVDQYIRRVLGGDEQEMTALVDNLTINETTFFRNTPQLDLFAQVAIPELVKIKRQRNEPPRLEIWSAACSTGQEVYTLAILAYEALRFLPQWDFHILGTDISTSVLAAAQRGVYPKARLDKMPPHLLSRYFDDLGEEIRVKDALRRKVALTAHNLRDPFPKQRFDIIFCRNVMIYFSRDDQVQLSRRFETHLTEGGFLFIGHSESLQGLGIDLKLRIESSGVAYQKVGKR